MPHTDSYLTLCVEERSDDNYDDVTNRLFVSYDVEQESYVVYGRRQSSTLEFEQFFFRGVLKRLTHFAVPPLNGYGPTVHRRACRPGGR